MIDIHAHILPGVDDGAPDMDSALEMAALSAESGVTILAATPHSSAFRNQNLWDENLLQRMKELKTSVEREKIPLRIVPGMEIFCNSDTAKYLKDRRLIGLCGSRYPLVEFAFTDYEEQATEILEDICAIGMRPVVAHPERYEYIQQDPTILNYWVRIGCMLQVNRGSLLGRFGRREESLAIDLVERGFVTAVASDAHSPRMRTPVLSDAQRMLEETFSPAIARKLLEDNPWKILNNEEIQREIPLWFR